MFFILSKTLNYLLQPLTIVVLLFLGSFFLRRNKWGKRLKIFAIVLSFLFTNDFISNEVVRWYETPITPIDQISKQYEWGIVLTGVTATNKELNDRVYVNNSPDRVNHSLLLYKKGVIKKILISGGSGKLLNPEYSEANQLVSLYRLMGVDSADIVVEGESRNTYESAVAVKKMLAPVTTPDKCLLITSGYHMPRSKACFKRQNWSCDVFSTDLRFHQREYTPDVLIIPKLEAAANWHSLLKEWVGFIAYWVSGYV